MWRCDGRAARRLARALGLVALALGCSHGLAGPEGIGRLELARLVAVGDSYLAGVTDGALFVTGQESSIPVLFLRQGASDADFAQPLVSDPGIATDDVQAGRLTLVSSRPLALARLPRGTPLALDLPRPYDNLAVPNGLLAEVLVAQSSDESIFGNPFYDLVLRSRGTVAQQVAQREATLILLWLGTQDVLSFVLAGGDPALAPGLPTSVGTFTTIYETLLDRLFETTDQVVLFTIPDPTRFPVLSAVPTVALDPATGDTVLQTLIEPKIDPRTGQQEVDSLGIPQFVTTQTPVPLIGPAGRLGASERLTLEALPLIAQGIGVPVALGGTGGPLPDSVILDADEVTLAREAVTGYNTEIRRMAAERDLAVVDVHALVEKMATTGVISDGVLLTTEWLFGQAFSLDGTTFTLKGYGVVTNLLIDAVNAHYGSRLRHVRTADLPGIPLFGQ